MVINGDLSSLLVREVRLARNTTWSLETGFKILGRVVQKKNRFSTWGKIKSREEVSSILSFLSESYVVCCHLIKTLIPCFWWYTNSLRKSQTNNHLSKKTTNRNNKLCLTNP
jgi:hypothetical protein